MRAILFILYFCIAGFNAAAQHQTIITGMVRDSITGEALIGASIRTGPLKGTVTGSDGRFRISTEGRQARLSCYYLGYVPAELDINTEAGDTIRLNIFLRGSSTPLDEVVITAGRYEQRLAEVMVSVDVIKPGRIMATSTTSLEDILKQTPGVEVLDGQPSIRGGSGFSYGAGSRVLVLMDNLPIISGDVGDVKWDYLPVENTGQIEIIKGASSVLYGSSALNGVFNIRPKYPGEEPSTQISLYSGVYFEPARKETVWWDRNPFFTGLDFSHSRKIHSLDLVLSGSLFRNEGYREDEYVDRGRLKLQLRQRSKKISGLAYGLNSYGMLTDKSDFLLWRDSRSGALRQNPQTVSALNGNRFNIDPFLEYTGRGGDRHSLRGRYFHIDNRFPVAQDKNNRSGQAYLDYIYRTTIAGRFTGNLGISGSSTGSASELYGNHTAGNMAIFGQIDGPLRKDLNASMGLRMERFIMDGEVEYSNPVFRAGLNYRLAGNTYLRASFGQGYRFPSIAEKYTATSVGSLNIYPNPSLVSESGWSSEVGLKQGLKAGKFQAYADLAFFLTEYNNMIEYVFGLYPANDTIPPGPDDYGFKAHNVGKARITGFEISLYGNGKIGKYPLNLMAGYTFIHPVDVSAADTITGRAYTSLKYRRRHSFKVDAEIEAGRFRAGLTLVMGSSVDRLDKIFTDPLFGNIILPGFPAYWEENNTAFAVLDARVLCNITPWLTAGIVLKNALNTEYSVRPGDIQAPANLTLRLTAGF